MTFTRRDALKTFGALAGTAAASRLLSACGGGAGKIDTLVFMMMENRSYDHYLGARKLVEGLPGDGLVAGMSNPDQSDVPVPIWPATTNVLDQCVADGPPHEWDSSRVQFNNGANDGFVIAFQNSFPTSAGREPMQYQTRETLPVTNALADAYTVCDRWFGSLLGPTLPNRMYWHAATSNGAMSNEDVLNGAFRDVPSIYHRLDAAGIEWAYYYGDAPVLSFLTGISLEGRLRRFYNQFLDDAIYGRLPPVVYIDPFFSANDDHPPHHPLLGQQLIAATYQALATSPQWEHLLFVLTYDENGGFFDHVPPSTSPDEREAAGFNQLGFRVPALVIGPYAKAGYVSSVPYEHTSALKHIENVHALEPLTVRDAASNDLSDTIDLVRLEAGTPAAPITLPAVEIDESQLPDSCHGTSFKRASFDHDILRWADANSTRLGKLDRRRYVREDIFGIAEYLDRHGLGRIRRRG